MRVGPHPRRDGAQRRSYVAGFAVSLRPQAPSPKPQASSLKPQASSIKLQTV